MSEQMREVIRRGDSFDIGSEQASQAMGNFDIAQIIQNPGQLANILNLNEKQATNVVSVLAAGGAGLSHKFLSEHIGDELAAAVGGFLGAYIGKRLIGGK